MTVQELIAKLALMPAHARVLFDTEAARFHVHCVPIDRVHLEPYYGDTAFVVLHTDDPREH